MPPELPLTSPPCHVQSNYPQPEPDFFHTQTNSSKAQSSYSLDRPGSPQMQPDFSQTQLSYTLTQPDYFNAQPEYSNTQIDYSNSQPPYFSTKNYHNSQQVPSAADPKQEAVGEQPTPAHYQSPPHQPASPQQEDPVTLRVSSNYTVGFRF